MSPALAGRFLTTVPPGKSLNINFEGHSTCVVFSISKDFVFLASF